MLCWVTVPWCIFTPIWSRKVWIIFLYLGIWTCAIYSKGSLNFVHKNFHPVHILYLFVFKWQPCGFYSQKPMVVALCVLQHITVSVGYRILYGNSEDMIMWSLYSLFLWLISNSLLWDSLPSIYTNTSWIYSLAIPNSHYLINQIFSFFSQFICQLQHLKKSKY